MSNMIERVARALAFASLDAETQAAVDLDAHMLHVRDHYEELARAAIEAMRLPTEHMLEATDDVVIGYRGEYEDHNEYCTFAVAREIWTVMIDAALQEPSK